MPRLIALSARTDDELLISAVAGDQAAIDELCARHRASVERTCRSILRCPEDAADAAQETLMSVVRRLPQLDAENLNFGGYLHVAARNRALQAARNRARRTARECCEETPGLQLAESRRWDDPEDAVLRRELAGRVRDACATLPERQRQAVVLSHFMDLAPGEVATHVGDNANNVAQLTFRARTRLRRELTAVAA